MARRRALPPAQGRGRHPDPQHPRPGGAHLVVAAVHRACWSTSASAAGCRAAAATPAPGRSSRSTSTRAAPSPQVQGSRPQPYQVRIGVPAFGKAEWAAGRARRWPTTPRYAAALLTGEMPRDIEGVFDGGGALAVPGHRPRPGDGLQLPRPRRAVQAPRRGVLRAGRAVRRRPVRRSSRCAAATARRCWRSCATRRRRGHAHGTGRGEAARRRHGPVLRGRLRPAPSG